MKEEPAPALRIALVMPSLNEEATIGPAMLAVRASLRQPDEILVVDGGSTDRTHELLKGHAAAGLPIKLLIHPGKLPGAARNEGALASTCDVLLFLDFGNVIDPHWIGEMARPFEADPRTEAVGGLYAPLMTNDFERCVAAIQYQAATVFANLSPEEQRARVPAKVILGGLGMAVRRDTYLRLGGQPHWLRAGEDWLFGRKLHASGAPTAVALGARLYHHMRPTPGDLFRQNRLYARGEGRLGTSARQHGRTAGVYLVVAAALLSALWWWPAAMVAVGVAAFHLYWTGNKRMRGAFGEGAVRGRRGVLALAVVTKDAGSLVGYAWGLWERLTQPHWREQQRRYLAGG